MTYVTRPVAFAAALLLLGLLQLTGVADAARHPAAHHHARHHSKKHRMHRRCVTKHHHRICRTAKTSRAHAPGTPTGLTVTGSDQADVWLTWTPATWGTTAVGYDVYKNGTKVLQVSNKYAKVTNLACGTSYSFTVDAYDQYGHHSAQTSPVTGSTTACPTTTTTTSTTSTTSSTSGTTTTTSPTSSSGFVKANGTSLTLNGSPYRFTGLNWFQANMTSGLTNCSGWAGNLDVDNQMADIAGNGTGNRVVRAWFFQDMATTNGGRDWTAFDRTLAAAKAHGLKVIATLGDQWNYCEGPYKTESWYSSGYKSTTLPGDTVPYRNWVQEIVSRYANDPTIAMWELANEPEIHTYDGETSCPSDSLTVMKGWASDVSSLIKSIDPNHLVSLGGGGNGNCGTLDGDYVTVMSLPTLDVCSYHDYWGATVAMSTDPSNGVKTRIDQCNTLNKPVYAGESGVSLNAVSSLSERATDFANKIQAQYGEGADGFVAWNWYKTSDIDYRIGPGDPALGALGLG